jgi:ATP-dependent Lhr-like helicase
LVVLHDGVPAVWFDRAGHHLVVFPRGWDDPSWAAALAELVTAGRERSVEVRKVDGGPVPEPIAAALRAASFVDGYRGLVRRS